MSTGRSSLSWEASTSAEASPDESSTVGSLEGALARRGLQKNKNRGEREQHLRLPRASPEAPVCIMHARLCLTAQWLHGRVRAALNPTHVATRRQPLLPSGKPPPMLALRPLAAKYSALDSASGFSSQSQWVMLARGLLALRARGAILCWLMAPRCCVGGFGPQKHKPPRANGSRLNRGCKLGDATGCGQRGAGARVGLCAFPNDGLSIARCTCDSFMHALSALPEATQLGLSVAARCEHHHPLPNRHTINHLPRNVGFTTAQLLGARQPTWS
jgi:hypothetical protein